MLLDEWIEHYRHAWETADVHEILSLFTPTATYRESVFNEPCVGHEGIAAYWRNHPGRQRNVKVKMGRPVVGADRVTVEWWTTMTDPDKGDITVTGCLLLRFDSDGLCTELWEYWITSDGWTAPPARWGGVD